MSVASPALGCPASDQAGRVHSVETAGAVDGPGLRFVVFLTGCPLACAYCHNPDTQKLQGGQVMPLATLLAEIGSYKNYMQRSGGGVTVSGGEPLVQAAFTEALLRGCKEMGLHTALDTSGYLGKAATDSLLAVTDLVLLDIKSGLPDLYHKVTNVALQPTLDFARRLADLNKPVWVRFVLVPGLTDSEENIRAVADIIRPLHNIERIEVLPFHKMGESKWKELARTYTLYDTPPATFEQAEQARALFREVLANSTRPAGPPAVF